MEWFWWDWSLSQWLTGFLQCFDAVDLVIWPVKIVPEMTYKVSSGTLSLYTLTHHLVNSILPSCSRLSLALMLACIDCTTCVMCLIKTDDSVAWCVSLFVCQAPKMCQNSSADRGPVWGGDLRTQVTRRWIQLRRRGGGSMPPSPG